MRKVLLTATVQSHIAQFHKPLISMLKENGYEVHVAAKNNLVEKNGLKLDEPDKVFDIPFERSPLSMKNVDAYHSLKKILSENTYDVIHCNTPMGGVITRLAARKSRKAGTKVFYTAHGFHFYQGAPIKNWMIYYPIEKVLSRYTDKLITISTEDFSIAKKRKFKANIEHIHGVGANSDKYYLPPNELIQNLKQEKGYLEEDFICVCTGELNDNKNQITILKAVPVLLKEIPNCKLILAGNGPNNTSLMEFITKMGLVDCVRMTGYVTDLEKYVMISDIVISASQREGLGLNLVEGMLCAKPIVASLNRGHKELIMNKVNGYLVKPLEVEEYVKAILKIYSDKKLSQYMANEGILIAQKYAKENVAKELANIYEINI